ncbi:hypothetical protein HPB52_003795 [Rhipicephalus sanguineus]|uniref:Uncharacterized protein n=1 Tax=Rhipicephalus sanguineus TaxID=34632 RepID=A0A9D4T2T5_RHISA|nr:hypothetical protein HPB52_003795 [Rhipicephalus sanguineus]
MPQPTYKWTLPMSSTHVTLANAPITSDSKHVFTPTGTREANPEPRAREAQHADKGSKTLKRKLEQQPLGAKGSKTPKSRQDALQHNGYADKTQRFELAKQKCDDDDVKATHNCEPVEQQPQREQRDSAPERRAREQQPMVNDATLRLR